MSQRARDSVAWTLRNRFGRKYMSILEGDRVDAAIMLELAQLRRDEDEIDEEMCDPERNKYVYTAGERPLPTARYHVLLELRRAAEQPGEFAQ